jgi:hypothetical protein
MGQPSGTEATPNIADSSYNTTHWRLTAHTEEQKTWTNKPRNTPYA